MLCYDFSHFCPLKRMCNAENYNASPMPCTAHNQLSARVDSSSASPQINFLVVVHGRMQNLPWGPTFWEAGRIACREARGFGGMLPPEFLFEWCNLVRFRAYFHNFLLLLYDRNLVSFGDVLLRFCLKMTKIMINCSHVLPAGFEGRLIRGEYW